LFIFRLLISINKNKWIWFAKISSNYNSFDIFNCFGFLDSDFISLHFQIHNMLDKLILKLNDNNTIIV